MAEAPPDTDADPLEPRSEEITPVDELVFRNPPEDFHFRKLLLDISTQISDADLQGIKYQYLGELKFGVEEKIQTALELFHVLEKRCYIHQAVMIHLQQIVMMISDESVRQDLMLKIYEYSEKHKSIYFRKPTDEPENGYRRVKFHIIAPSGSKFKRLNRRQIQDLVNAVAMYTGVDGSDIRVLGIESSNSIYVTLLLPEKHCDILVLLVKKGFPILTEMRVDIVSFDDNISIEVSTGKVVEDEIPPTYDSPEQKIHCLEENLAKIQKENMNYARQIAELKNMIMGEIPDDIEGKMKEFDDVMTDIRRTDSDDKRFNRAVSLNTQLVRSIEKKRFEATEIKMKSDIMGLKAEVMEYKHGLNVVEDIGIDAVLKETPDEQQGKSSTNSDTPMKTDMSGFLRNKLNRVVQRAYDMGYRKTIIREVVAASMVYTLRTALKQKQKELGAVVEENRIQQLIFEQTLPAFGLKGSLLTQLETVFKTAGKTIPCDTGYAVEIIKLAMEISKAISDEERLKLECDHTDVPSTEPIRNEKSFLLLRLLYLENIESDGFIPIEVFMNKKLKAIARDDLHTMWREGYKNAALVRGTGFQNVRKLQPTLDRFLRNMNSKLSEGDRKKLSKKLPIEEECRDEELLVRIVGTYLSSGLSDEAVVQNLRKLFNEIGRADLSAELDNFQKTQISGIGSIWQQWVDIMRKISTKLTNADKDKLKKKLKDKSKLKEKDDILVCLVMEHFEGAGETPIEQLASFIETELSAIGKHDVCKAVLDQEMQMFQPQISPIMLPLLRMAGEPNTLLLQRMQELENKFEKLSSPNTSADNLPSAVMNVPVSTEQPFNRSHIFWKRPNSGPSDDVWRNFPSPSATGSNPYAKH